MEALEVDVKKRMSKKEILKKIFLNKTMIILYWIIVLAIVWEIIAFYMDSTRRIPEYVLPHLGKVFESVIHPKKINQNYTVPELVAKSAGLTLSRAFRGFAIGIILGFLLALLMQLSGIVEKIAMPYLMILQMIPILGMAPIVYAITKNINTSRTIIAAILTFYPVSVNTLAGFKSVEAEKLDLMKISSANKFQVYWKTYIPACLPSFFTGLKIAAPMAITASILVDTLQGGGGLGNVLSQSLKHAMDIMVFWEIVFLSAFIGVSSVLVVRLIEYLFSPQKHGFKNFIRFVKRKIDEHKVKKGELVIDSQSDEKEGDLDAGDN